MIVAARNTSSVSPRTWQARYEELRGTWLEGRNGWGVNLLIRRGMAAWIRAWPEDSEQQLVSWHASEQTLRAEISGDLRRELMTRIVGMILDRRQEAVA